MGTAGWPPAVRSDVRTRHTARMSGRVERISVAPVKSLGLTHPESVELSPSGVVGDRRFWMVTGEGRLVNGKLCPELMQVRPEWDWAEEIDPYALSEGDPLSQVATEGIYNRAILISGERSPYPQGLETLSPF